MGRRDLGEEREGQMGTRREMVRQREGRSSQRELQGGQGEQ